MVGLTIDKKHLLTDWPSEYACKRSPWEAIATVGKVSSVSPGGLAHQQGLEVGDLLVAVNGKQAAGANASQGLRILHAAVKGGAAMQTLELNFELSRFNGRRSVEFRFFVYWPV